MGNISSGGWWWLGSVASEPSDENDTENDTGSNTGSNTESNTEDNAVIGGDHGCLCGTGKGHWGNEPQ